MHIVVLNGSPHTQGMTASLLRALVHPLEEEHVVEWVDVNRLNMKACRGCMACRPEEECALPRDDGHRVGESLRRAEVLVVGTPTYWGNMPAPLKLLFDRNVTAFESFAGRFPRPRKRGAFGFILVTSGSPRWATCLPNQAAGALRAVRTILRAGGLRIHGRMVVGGREHFADRRERLEAHAERRGARLAARLRRSSRRPLPARS